MDEYLFRRCHETEPGNDFASPSVINLLWKRVCSGRRFFLCWWAYLHLGGQFGGRRPTDLEAFWIGPECRVQGFLTVRL